jgi:hypothetical protein
MGLDTVMVIRVFEFAMPATHAFWTASAAENKTALVPIETRLRRLAYFLFDLASCTQESTERNNNNEGPVGR